MVMPVSRHVSSHFLSPHMAYTLYPPTSQRPGRQKKQKPRDCGSHLYDADRDARLNFLEW